MNRDETNSDWFDGTETDAAPMAEGLDVWGFLRRRKALIILGAVVGLGLGFLVFARTKPTYQSSSQLLIQANVAQLPVEGGVDAQLRYAAGATDHAFVIQSPKFVEKTVESMTLNELPSLMNHGNPVSVIRRGLTVKPREEGSGILNFTFRGLEPEDCAEVLNALMDTYIQFLGENQKTIGTEMVDIFSNAQKGLLRELEEKEKEYNDFRDKAPLLWRNGEATNIHQERQAAIETARSTVLLNNSQLEARINSIDSAIERGIHRDVILSLANQGEGGETAALTTLKTSYVPDDSLFSLRLQDELLAQKYGPRHPGRKAIQRQIEFTQQHLEERNAERLAAMAEGADAQPNKPQDPVVTYLESLREQLQTGLQEYAKLTELFSVEEVKAKELAAHEDRDALLMGDINRTQALFDAVVQRLQEINLMEAYGGDRYNTQILSSAGPGSKVAPELGRMLLTGAALGLMGGIGIGYLLERSDKTFRSPEEISRALQLPLVGHIAELDTKAVDPNSPFAPALCTAHRPKSTDAEAFRAIRTALFFTTRGQEHRVIQVTSPLPGDGKSTVAANVAVTIAQSGKSVLILDGDFRRPTQHKLFGLKMDTGLASVVDGKADPQEAIQQTGIDNLSVMACGPRPENPSELLTSPEFLDVLNLLRDQFDFVLVDTPPLLAVTDAGIVAARVDGVLFALSLRKDNRIQATRARDVLADMNAKVVGVVVNGVGGKKGSYGYHQGSGYGYGYGGYSYGESGEEQSIKKYYDDGDGADRKTQAAGKSEI